MFPHLESSIELVALDFARTDYQGPPLTSLMDIVQYVKPTALLGLSTIRVCRFMQHIQYIIVSYLKLLLECIHRRRCALDGLS